MERLKTVEDALQLHPGCVVLPGSVQANMPTNKTSTHCIVKQLVHRCIIISLRFLSLKMVTM